jgi:hypothetical protein
VVIFALLQAHTATLSRKDRRRFLIAVANSLGAQAGPSNVLQFRPRNDDLRVLTATRQARSWWMRTVSFALRLEE